MSTTAAATTAETQSRQTSLAALRTPPANEAQLPVVTVGFTSLQSFELVQRVAKMFASSDIVPKRFQNNISNCAIALEMAQRLGASPLMVMQNLYVVHGTPGWSAKFLIAAFNQCGRFSSIRFKFQGTEGQDNWGARAWAIEKETGERLEGPLITIELAKKEGWYNRDGSKWKTMPEQMLRYRSGAWFINTTAPEISMGLKTDDEIGDTYDATRGPDGEYGVTVHELRVQRPQVTGPSPEEIAAWVATLSGSPASAEHEASWTACCAAFGGNPPSECDAAYQNRKEALAENAGKQLDM